MENTKIEQFWYFTFGHGQEHFGKYTKIYGTKMSAHNAMFNKFGAKWAMQYSSEGKAGVVEFNLTELEFKIQPSQFHVRIKELMDKDVVYQDEEDPEGYFVPCNELFCWGTSDSEDITEESLPVFEKALADCKGCHVTAASLYCARIRKERPQVV